MGDESAESLEGLAVQRWWADDVDAAIALRERAYVLRREAGQTIEAARVAGFLAWDHGAMRGAGAVANGWLQRARHLIAALPSSAEHAWLPLIEASFHLDTDHAKVLQLSRESAALARRHGALDIEMTARTLEGLALVSTGHLQEGTRLLDEGTAAATAGELHDPIAIGSCCCNMIIACERSRDFDRAAQWCTQLEAYAERTGQRPMLALCRAHHGTVQMHRGAWPEAEADLTWAADELTRLRPPLAGYARCRLAQLRIRQGREDEARAALEQAGAHVLVALVQAQLALAHGDAITAADHAERHLRALGADQPIQAAAGLEVLVAANHDRAAGARLQEIADIVQTPALQAAAATARGRLALADNDAADARRAFEDAVDAHARSAAAFDEAQARLLLAEALTAEGRPASAAEEIQRARDALRALGATTAARHADAALGRPAGLTRREAEVLALVADGLSNRQIAERLIVSEHTVHRHMANIYARLGVSSRAAAVAAMARKMA